MASTPVYGWPYLAKADLLTYTGVSGEGLALGIEATVAALAARVAALEAAATSLGSDYTAYTPAWTVISGTNPTPASHIVSGRWKRVDVHLALVEFRIVGASASGWGSGVYLIGLPWAITAGSAASSAGSGHLLDSGTQEYGIAVKPNSTTTLRLFLSGSGGSVANSFPFTWTTSDTMEGSILVEPA